MFSLFSHSLKKNIFYEIRLCENLGQYDDDDDDDDDEEDAPDADETGNIKGLIASESEEEEEDQLWG